MAAGADLLHGFPVWNWSALTVRSVASRAGVNERTVYRHFATERELRDQILARLREEAGVDLDGMSLDAVPAVAARILEYVSTFPIEPRLSTDPTVAAENVRQRAALLSAVGDAAAGWSDRDRRIAGGVLDLLWSPVSYERLVLNWGLPPKDSIRAVTWVMGLVQQAIRDGRKP